MKINPTLINVDFELKDIYNDPIESVQMSPEKAKFAKKSPDLVFSLLFFPKPAAAQSPFANLEGIDISYYHKSS